MKIKLYKNTGIPLILIKQCSRSYFRTATDSIDTFSFSDGWHQGQVSTEYLLSPKGSLYKTICKVEEKDMSIPLKLLTFLAGVLSLAVAAHLGRLSFRMSWGTFCRQLPEGSSSSSTAFLSQHPSLHSHLHSLGAQLGPGQLLGRANVPAGICPDTAPQHHVRGSLRDVAGLLPKECSLLQSFPPLNSIYHPFPKWFIFFSDV